MVMLYLEERTIEHLCIELKLKSFNYLLYQELNVGLHVCLEKCSPTELYPAPVLRYKFSCQLGIMRHAFNYSSQEAEANKSLIFRPAWSI